MKGHPNKCACKDCITWKKQILADAGKMPVDKGKK